nr:Ty3/gypsy retrotransposon protein [Tanacetum cinerariifolium]
EEGDREGKLWWGCLGRKDGFMFCVCDSGRNGPSFYIVVLHGRCIQHSDTIPLDLAAVLSKFSFVFELSIGLLPSRSHDHSIVLQKGVNAIKVRPYRYPVSQKTEIEKMVNEMLKEGLIQPRNNPFSTSVLLIYKKDDT